MLHVISFNYKKYIKRVFSKIRNRYKANLNIHKSIKGHISKKSTIIMLLIVEHIRVQIFLHI